ncbi:MAG: zinc ribbon domain-containing protein [Pseudomonadota bacterium]|nr:zinc ribbon domain-containing protein [Pseudomonadota bacterium]
MPIYEYSCPDCGHEFEAIQKFSDDPIKDCPSCKAANVKKLISMTSFVLKGGGWYKDHYGLKKSGGSAEGSSGGSSSEGASSSASSSSSSGGGSAEGAKSTPAAPSSSGSTSGSSTPAPAAPAK